MCRHWLDEQGRRISLLHKDLVGRGESSIFYGTEMSVGWGFPGGSVVKNPSANAGDMGSIPELGRSPEEGNGNPLQYSCLENSMDRGARWATAHGVGKSQP